MLSYLTNRHYHTLTQLLPPQLRGSQPQKIYYKTFIDNETLKLMEINKKITHKTLGIKHGHKNSTKKQIRIKNINACPICYQTHISVQYNGHAHICVKCRNLVRDQYGNQIKIFLDNQGNIMCLGILPKSFDRNKIAYYVTDHTKLQVSNTGVYATFAGKNQLVLILKQKETKI